MKLGILINTDKHLKHILGLTQAALDKNHEVIIFAMDGGNRLLAHDSFVKLAGMPGVTLSLCEHSAKEQGIGTGDLPEGITCGSQLNNAMMNHEADKVLVL